jgi:cobalt-zinc-cadmium efflux system outer membrane protein
MCVSRFRQCTTVHAAFRLLFMLMAVPCAAVAQTAPPPGGMTLQNAIQLAISSNPALIGQQFVISAAEARRDHAALRPPLTLGADIENLLGTGNAGTTRSLETTLRLGTVIELGAKRALRITSAERAMTAASIQRDIAALDLLGKVTRRFIDNLSAQEKLEIAREHVERAEEVVAAVKVRLRAGIGSPVEEGNALVHLREMEVALLAAEADVRKSWGLLAATWGAPPDGSGQAVGDFYALPELAPFATFAAKIDANPYLARFAAERVAAAANADLARAGRTPDISVSGGVRRLEALNDQALVLGFSVPLGSAGRNAAVEREAAARIAQADYAQSAARLESMAALHGLYEDAFRARAAFVALRESALPLATQTLARAEEGFRAGRLSLFDVSTAQDQLHDIEAEVVDAAASFHHAIAEIERLTHAPIEVQSTAGQGVTP